MMNQKLHSGNLLITWQIKKVQVVKAAVTKSFKMFISLSWTRAEGPLQVGRTNVINTHILNQSPGSFLSAAAVIHEQREQKHELHQIHNTTKYVNTHGSSNMHVNLLLSHWMLFYSRDFAHIHTHDPWRWVKTQNWSVSHRPIRTSETDPGRRRPAPVFCIIIVFVDGVWWLLTGDH